MKHRRTGQTQRERRVAGLTAMLAAFLIMLSQPATFSEERLAQTPSAVNDAANDQTGLIRYVAEHPDGRAPSSVDHHAWLSDRRHLPIGVFDSGIGGLTVLEAILTLDAFDNDNLKPGADGRPDFENERFVYLGDQANMPYGNYAAAGQEQYLRELILKDAIFLLGRRYWPTPDAGSPAYDKPPVKAIVIACNTATAYGLQDIRRALQEWKIPVFVVGVVEAGARGVTDIVTGDQQQTVAVLATVGTCSSMAWPKAIGSAVGLAGKRAPAVIQQGSVGLAGAIEGDPAFVQFGSSSGTSSEKSASSSSAGSAYQGPHVDSTSAPLDVRQASVYGFDSAGLLGDFSSPATLRLNSVSNYVKYDVATLVESWRQSGGTRPIDTVVLACTHFPLVEQDIRSAFRRLRELKVGDQRPYRHLIAEQITVVNPAEMTARELFRSLARERLRLGDSEKRVIEHDQFYMSVPAKSWPGVQLTADGALQREYKYGRSTGRYDVEDTRMVPMTPELLPATSLNLIRQRLPAVWKRLQSGPRDSG